MVRGKNYETVSTFVEVMERKLCAFFPDTVYIGYSNTCSRHIKNDQVSDINECTAIPRRGAMFVIGLMKEKQTCRPRWRL